MGVVTLYTNQGGLTNIFRVFSCYFSLCNNINYFHYVFIDINSIGSDQSISGETNSVCFDLPMIGLRLNL